MLTILNLNYLTSKTVVCININTINYEYLLILPYNNGHTINAKISSDHLFYMKSIYMMQHPHTLQFSDVCFLYNLAINKKKCIQNRQTEVHNISPSQKHAIILIHIIRSLLF